MTSIGVCLDDTFCLILGHFCLSAILDSCLPQIYLELSLKWLIWSIIISNVIISNDSYPKIHSNATVSNDVNLNAISNDNSNIIIQIPKRN